MYGIESIVDPRRDDFRVHGYNDVAEAAMVEKFGTSYFRDAQDVFSGGEKVFRGH